MDRTWLADQLASGFSIEAVARTVGRDPSTVAYWVAKHGLVSQHAAKHAARGGIARATLEPLVEQGCTVQQIAQLLGVGGTTVRRWLKKHGLATAWSRTAAPAGRPSTIVRRCRTHGMTAFTRSGDGKRYRCRLCRSAAVSARRRRVKQILVADAGGACQLCGYDRFAGALEFHHLDPSEKAFAIADRGLARSLEQARAEVAKCVLVCANCHAELEGGIATIAPSAPADPQQSRYTGRG
jgi:transposase-like protein